MGALISILTTIAPTLATLAGGPLAKTVVEQIAKVLGTPSTEEAILNAIQTDPEVAKARLQAIESAYEVALAEVAAQRANMEAYYNQAMADSEKGPFWSWARPAAAWVALWYFVMVSCVVLRDLWDRTYDIMAHLDMLIIWGGLIMTLAGIWFVNRSSEKIKAKELLSEGSPDSSKGPLADLISKTIGNWVPKK